MSTKPMKIPGPDHPIAIESSSMHVVVTVGGKVVADSRKTLALKEGSYPVVHYIPRSDVDMDLLQRSDHASYCPYKGDASYFDIPAGGVRATNAIWSYEQPYLAVAAIKDHLAFYPERVDSFTVTED